MEAVHDPRFTRSVIYMLRHHATWAIGLMVNRPVGSVPPARVPESRGREHVETRGRSACSTAGRFSRGAASCSTRVTEHR
jgi:putative AlgH/UPF0301 family transcriptional regulator